VVICSRFNFLAILAKINGKNRFWRLILGQILATLAILVWGTAAANFAKSSH
jgi:hypothetical protein